MSTALITTAITTYITSDWTSSTMTSSLSTSTITTSSTTQRNLCLSESIRTDVGSLARVGRHAAPPGLAIQSEWTRVGRQFDPSRSAVLPGKNCRPTRIRADWYWSAKIGSELPIGMPTRPDRQFNAGNPPGSARIGTSFAELS